MQYTSGKKNHDFEIGLAWFCQCTFKMKRCSPQGGINFKATTQKSLVMNQKDMVADKDVSHLPTKKSCIITGK